MNVNSRKNHKSKKDRLRIAAEPVKVSVENSELDDVAVHRKLNGAAGSL